MNPGLKQLQPYPFERLNQLLEGIDVPNPISLTIGEPQHNPPGKVLDALKNNLHLIAKYPATKGSDELRNTIANWINHRYALHNLPVDPASQVLPVTGTREALFSAIQALLPTEGTLACPNPFYQIYEGAAILAGGSLTLINCTENNRYQVGIDQLTDALCDSIDILLICTPNNPTGQCLNVEQLERIIQLAHRHDFIVISDECYSELYPATGKAPAGLLQASAAINNINHARCLVFNSLSKRSNLPGLRSGFVAGDPSLIAPYLKYRTYHGCAMPMHHQQASIIAWQDEETPARNRAAYDDKYEAVLDILNRVTTASRPDASFYLWLKVSGCDQEFAKTLYSHTGVKVLPGTFLARDTDEGNPGYGYVRIALVDTIERCVQAASKIADFMRGQSND